MKGIYNIEIYNRYAQYSLSFKRNITIIGGKSSTGKTNLIHMIRDYYNNGKSSGVTLKSKVDCRVLEGRDWYNTLSNIKNSIVFVDEGNKFITSKEFAKAIETFDNYYVLITRQHIDTLPYSINEIYEFTENKNKDQEINKVYNTMSMLYGSYSNISSVIPDRVLSEDSKSGYEFFTEVCKNTNMICESAKGKSNISAIIMGCNDKVSRYLVIADGAAFGNEMERVMKAIHDGHSNWVLYLPESFEWLLLKSNTLRSKNQDIKSILDNPSDYIDSTQYISWERYFTSLIKSVMSEYNNSKFSYNKDKLNEYFKSQEIIDKVLSTITVIRFNKHN